jgi:hypothetical protein
MTNYETLKIKTALTVLKDSGEISELAFKEMINTKPLTVKAAPLGLPLTNTAPGVTEKQ